MLEAIKQKSIEARRATTYRHSEETKQKIAASHQGRVRTNWTVSDEHRNRLKNWVAEQPPEVIKEIVERGHQSRPPETYRRGPLDDERRQKLVDAGRHRRRLFEYGLGSAWNEWSLAVRTRDDFTCQDCGAKPTTIHAHHITSWDDAPDRRYDVENGVTLCPTCHKRRHRSKLTV